MDSENGYVDATMTTDEGPTPVRLTPAQYQTLLDQQRLQTIRSGGLTDLVNAGIVTKDEARVLLDIEGIVERAKQSVEEVLGGA